MRKFVSILALMLAVTTFGQVKFDLLPDNMRKYVGKVTKEQFDSIIGPPFEEREGLYCYEVINSFDDVQTGLLCYFRERDSVLVSVRFPTRSYLSYWIDFTMIKGYPKKASVAASKGLRKVKKDIFGNPYWVNLKFRGFGCQIYDIKWHHNFKTAVINYHVY